MKYSHVARFVSETPWAILPAKLVEIEAILAFHIEGGTFSAEELKARLGDPKPTETIKRGAVAVIPLQGVISHRMGSMTEMSGGMSTERFSAMFRLALEDPTVSAIVIDTNSPGGTAHGLTELAAEIHAARGQKPIVAQVNALAASAAYWAIASADQIVVTPSGDVGSIGVITAHTDYSKADAQEGITRTVISAGKFKAEGWGPLTDESREAIQGRVNAAYAVMTKDIARGRGVGVSAVRDGFGQGRVVSAQDAKDLGMIDRIATMDDTIRRVSGRRAGAGSMRAAVVQEPDRSWLDRF